jgi:hypothetical protein
MAEVFYFENTKTGKRYKIVSLDKETNKVRLRGEHAEFEETFDKARFKAMGYQLIRVQEGDSEDAE